MQDQNSALIRYLLRKREKGKRRRGIPFNGNRTRVLGKDFAWYFGRPDIGITALSRNGGKFVRGFLVADDVLQVNSGHIPHIRRQRANIGSGCDPENLEKLAEMILSGKQVHVFTSSEVASGDSPQILTFSLIKPPEELYVPGKEMQIIEIPSKAHYERHYDDWPKY